MSEPVPTPVSLEPAPEPDPGVFGHWRLETWLGLLVSALTSAVAMKLMPERLRDWALWFVGVLAAAGVKAASTAVNKAKAEASPTQAAHNEALQVENAALRSRLAAQEAQPQPLVMDGGVPPAVPPVPQK